MKGNVIAFSFHAADEDKLRGLDRWVDLFVLKVDVRHASRSARKSYEETTQDLLRHVFLAQRATFMLNLQSEVELTIV